MFDIKYRYKQPKQHTMAL